MSGLLGDVAASALETSIVSSAQLIAREGVDLRKSMNFRDGHDRLAVILVLPRADDSWPDEWDEKALRYYVRGHDSVTLDAGKEQDQRTMYESGRLSDNGKFVKAAQQYVGGSRAQSLQVQVYEKLDAGVWFDKGIFEVLDSSELREEGRRVFRFELAPANVSALARHPHTAERMLPASTKAAVWARAGGRCEECAQQSGLRFVLTSSGERLLCGVHRGEGGGLLR